MTVRGNVVAHAVALLCQNAYHGSVAVLSLATLRRTQNEKRDELCN